MKGRSAFASRFALTLLVLMVAPSSRAAIVEEVAAWVNGQIITRSELLAREREVMTQLSSRLVGEELDREVSRMRDGLLSDMIRELLLLQRAEILGLELDKVYQQALDQLKEQQGIKTNEELDQILKEEGITKEELKDTLLRHNVPDIMVNLEVREKISVTEEEAREYFNKHEEQFRTEETLTIREIVLTPENRTSEDLEKLAATVMAELESGTPFNELVVKYSEAPSRFKDGIIGPFKRGDLVRDLENVALALEVGKTSGPIRTQAGIHIIQLESHELAKEPSFEDARRQIISHLKQERFTSRLREYFKELMESNLIEVNPNYKQYHQES